MTAPNPPPPSEAALLPCPFCGDRGPEIVRQRGYHWLACTAGSDCAASGTRRETEADTIAAWNRRAGLSVVAEGMGVPRKLLVEAHACMRATGWHLANTCNHSGDGVIEAAVSDVEERVGALLAAAPQVERPVVAEGDGWLPIETAPRDGTRVLGFGPHDSRGHYINAVIFDRDIWTITWMTGYGEPTHWRPLPPPPKPEGAA